MGEIEFDIEQVEESHETVKQMFERHDFEFRKNHPIKQWINDLFDGGLFGYAPWYSLSHPHVLLADLGREIKWAYQRVVRGWDDRASWSIDYWLNDKLPDILIQLKENSHGIPMICFDGLPHDENYNYGEDGDKIAKETWNTELDKMIAGFNASKKYLDSYDVEEMKELEKVFEIGMASFTKHYHDLWD